MATIEKFADQIISGYSADHSRPDELMGSVCRAPDHSLFGGKILIEVKCIEKLTLRYTGMLTGLMQRDGVHAIGQVNTARILSNLKDPVAAKLQLSEHLNPIEQSIRNSKKQFEQYMNFKNIDQSFCILLIINSPKNTGNQTNISNVSNFIKVNKFTTEHIEHELWKRMGGKNNKHDIAGTIDAITFLAHPNDIVDKPRSYWLKTMVRQTLDPAKENDELAIGFLTSFHLELLKRFDNDNISRFKNSYYEPSCLRV